MVSLPLLGGALLLLVGSAPRVPADCGEAALSAASLPGHGSRPADRRVPIDRLLMGSSTNACAGLFGRPADAPLVARELDRLAQRIREEIAGRRDASGIVSAMNRVISGTEKFAYDSSPSDPENYLLDRVLARKRGNCLGMTVLYLALAERTGIPLRGVYVPGHCFARYDDGGTRINIEFANGGAAWDDARYVQVFGLSRGRPYLRSLSTQEMAGVYLKTLGAACSRKGLYREAERLYREAAVFYPRLPDAYYNLGVLFMRRGLVDEAIAQYRIALALDPGLASARNNLGAALAGAGRIEEGLREAKEAVTLAPEDVVVRANLARLYVSSGQTDDGIREFNRVLEVDNDNPKALTGLVNAYFIRGEYRDALQYCDRATRLGCRIDPVLRRTLEEYRLSGRD